MNNFENLLVEAHDDVMVVRIHRPRVLNALNAATLHEIEECFGRFSTNAGFGAAVLTGADTGKKPSFAAGADIEEMSRLSALELRDHSQLGQRAFACIEDAGKPVIAAIDGFALGGGLELAMSCHLRFASPAARLGQPEINLGIIPGFGGTQRLTKLVGRANSLELLLSGEMIDAERGAAIGLIDRVIPADELFQSALDIGRKLASKAPVARRLILDAVLRGEGMSRAEGNALESDHFGLVGSSLDVREGLAAFLEKRAASFKGN